MYTILALKYLSDRHFFKEDFNLNKKYRATRTVSDGDVKEFVAVILTVNALPLSNYQSYKSQLQTDYQLCLNLLVETSIGWLIIAERSRSIVNIFHVVTLCMQ